MDTSCSGVRICAALLLGLATVVPAWGQDDVEQGSTLPIDLPTALRLADERNLDVAIYVERVAEASARVAEARALAVPTLRIGGDYARHTGNIQETSGRVIDADRASRFAGAGVGLSVEIADAIFAPLVAKQDRAALVAAASANRHEVFVDVAAAYLRLLESRAAREVVQRALERALDLARLTADYAEAGEGLLADAEMAAVEPLLWEQRRLAIEEQTSTAAAELVRLLHLDAGVALEPTENEVPMLELVPIDVDVEALVARALADRPETEQYDALVAAAEADLKAQRYALFIPGVSLDYSTGRFGGALGSSIDDTGDRTDLALTLSWRFDGLGFGHRARTDEKRAQLRRVGLERDRLRDAIAAEVRESYARARSFKQQIEFADRAVARAQSAYGLNRDRIYDQEGLPLEALQAMQTLAAAEVAQVEARAEYSLAQIRLYTALGSPLTSQFP
ncbi:MAG TPA: TolC family protein [Gammaproteobacteria bacterium]